MEYILIVEIDRFLIYYNNKKRIIRNLGRKAVANLKIYIKIRFVINNENQMI